MSALFSPFADLQPSGVRALSSLYPSDTPMSEVQPDFRGMPFRRWKLLKIAEQAEAWYKRNPLPVELAPLNRKAVSTPRDNYGIKGPGV